MTNPAIIAQLTAAGLARAIGDGIASPALLPEKHVAGMVVHTVPVRSWDAR